MELTNRRHEVVATTVFDVADVAKVCAFEHRWSAAWHNNKQYRALVTVDGAMVILSRFLLDAPDGLMVDHVNRDTLDNRRLNLRLATHTENMQNKGLQRRSGTGVKNVSWNDQTRDYVVRVSVNKQTIRVGRFATLAEADAAARHARARHSPRYYEVT
jgi:hypothetical protein